MPGDKGLKIRILILFYDDIIGSKARDSIYNMWRQNIDNANVNNLLLNL